VPGEILIKMELECFEFIGQIIELSFPELLNDCGAIMDNLGEGAKYTKFIL